MKPRNVWQHPRSGLRYFRMSHQGQEIYRPLPDAPYDSVEFQLAYEEAKQCLKDSRAASARRMLEQWAGHAVKRASVRARERGMPCTITPADVLGIIEGQKRRCAISKTPFRIVYAQSTDPYAPSIDRIDNSLGYTKDNIRVVLWAVNVGRMDFSDETYIAVCAAVARAHGGTDAVRRPVPDTKGPGFRRYQLKKTTPKHSRRKPKREGW